MELKNYTVSLAGAIAGFLVGEFGLAFVLKLTGADLGWLWLPWIVAPVAGSITGALIFRCNESTKVWHWLLLAAPTPVCTYVIVLAYFAGHNIPTTILTRDSIAQIALALATALAVGMARMRRQRAVGGPVQVGAVR